MRFTQLLFQLSWLVLFIKLAPPAANSCFNPIIIGVGVLSLVNCCDSDLYNDTFSTAVRTQNNIHVGKFETVLREHIISDWRAAQLPRQMHT